MEVVNERQIKGIYQNHDSQKLHGAHYTPRNLADFLTKHILGQRDSHHKKNLTIFDPAVGDGELLFSLAKELLKRGVKKIDVFGFDIDRNAIIAAKNKLITLGTKINVEFYEQDFTKTISDEKKIHLKGLKFDYIIANPPYVRTQSLGVQNTTRFSNEYGLDGRIDLYYIFLLGIRNFMHDDTVAGFIVSNRFMTTKSGAAVRKGLIQNYKIQEAWDLGDTKLFEAAVLPAVLIFSKKNEMDKTKCQFTSIYSSEGIGSISNVQEVFEALERGGGHYRIGHQVFEVKSGVLDSGTDGSDVWRVSNRKTDLWLKQVKAHTEITFSEIGKVRVGVKTTADKIFIRKDWDSLSPELQPEPSVLKPLITHHIARRFKAIHNDNKKILYPHLSDGKKKVAIDLSKYPKAARYLNEYRQKLEAREYLISAGRNWFEIWVPHEPHMWAKDKIVFRDISEKPIFWMDRSGAIVNGDCYWLTLSEGVDSEYLWLALAVANSTFIEAFYDHKFNNKLYAGRRRFMTQYVEQFPIPKLSKDAKALIVKLAKKIYELDLENTQEDEVKLDKLIWQSFGFKN